MNSSGHGIEFSKTFNELYEYFTGEKKETEIKLEDDINVLHIQVYGNEPTIKKISIKAKYDTLISHSKNISL